MCRTLTCVSVTHVRVCVYLCVCVGVTHMCVHFIGLPEEALVLAVDTERDVGTDQDVAPVAAPGEALPVLQHDNATSGNHCCQLWCSHTAAAEANHRECSIFRVTSRIKRPVWMR